MSYVSRLSCVDCSRQLFPTAASNFCPHCGGLLEVEYDYSALQSDFNLERVLRRPATLWRWRELLPVERDANIVTLGEGGTPLHSCSRLAKALGVKALLVKDESCQPTQSFKDRTSAVAVSKALELGIRKAVTLSSGNAGSSLAAYCARAGIELLVLVGLGTSAQKVAMIQAYGQRVLQVQCSGDHLCAMLEKARPSLGLYEFTSFVNPYRHEGTKTYAYEVCEQLGWSPPDWMVFPIGTGSGIYGAWKGFSELRRLGLIDRLPKLAGVQSAASDDIVRAFRAGLSSTTSSEGSIQESIAHAIVPCLAVGGARRPLRAMQESGGWGETVSDAEILEAMDVLGREGIFVEPSGAAPVAAAKKLVESGRAGPEDVVVCVATASGLKQPDSVALFRRPPERLEVETLMGVLRTYV